MNVSPQQASCRWWKVSQFNNTIKLKSASIYFPIWLTPEHHFCLFWLLFIPAFECKETVRKFMNEVLLTFQTLLCTRGCFLLGSWDEVIPKPPSLPSVLTQKRFKWTDLHFLQCKRTYSSFPARQHPPNSCNKWRKEKKKGKKKTPVLFPLWEAVYKISLISSGMSWDNVYPHKHWRSCNYLDMPS